MPGLSWEIVRPDEVHLTGIDLDGNEVSIEADEYAGRRVPARARPPRRRAPARAARRRPADAGQAGRARDAHGPHGRAGAARPLVRLAGGPGAACRASCTSARRRWRSRRCGPCRRRVRGRPRRVAGRPRGAGAGSALTPSPVKAAALELGLPVTDVVDDVLAGRRRPRRGGRLRADHQAARAGRAADGEPPLLAAARAGGARRRSSGRSSPATSETGVCVMDVEEGLDTGGIYACERGADRARRDRRRAAGRAGRGGHPAAGRHAGRRARRRPRPQEGEPPTPTKIDPAELEIDWSRPAAEIDRLVRLGGAWTTFRGPAAQGVAGRPATARRRRRRRPATARSSWSRCSPRARAAWRRPTGPDGARLGDPAPGSARDRRPARLALDALVRIDVDGPTPTSSCPSCSSAVGPRPSATGLRDRLVYGTDAHAAGVRLAGRPVPRSASSTRRCGPRCASAPTSSLPRHAAARRGAARPSRPCRRRCGASSTRCCAGGRRAGRLARRRDPAELPRLDRRAARRRPRPRRRARRARGDERAGRGDRARRRLRPGPRRRSWSPRRSARRPGERVADLCAAPGGKATGLAGAGARVVALDQPARRAGLVAANASRLGPADRRRRSPTAGARPCGPASPTGCWSTRRARASARCAAGPTPAGGSTRTPSTASPTLQRELLDGAAELVAPGGTLVYSVCTLTRAESIEVADRFAAAHPSFAAARPAGRAVGAVGERRRCSCPRPRAPTAWPSAGGFRWHDCEAASVDGPTTGGQRTAKVIVVSDGVVDGTRDDRGGPAVTERLTEAGFDGRRDRGRRRRRRVGGERAARPGRRVHRAGRHHRRHRLRPPRPHARGHPRRARARGPRPRRGHAPGQPARPPLPRRRRHHRQRPRAQPAGLARRARSSASTPSSTSSPTPSTSSPAAAPTDRSVSDLTVV